MHSARVRAALAVSITLLIALGAGACGSGEREVPSRSRPLELRVAQGEWPEPRIDSVRTLPAPEALGEGWSVRPANSGEAAVNPTRQISGRVVALHYLQQQVRLEVDLDEDLERFDLVRLTMSCPGFLRMRFIARFEDGVDVASDPLTLLKTVEPTPIEFDLSGLRAAEGRPSSLVLHVMLAQRRVLVREIELLRRSPSARLPSPLEEPVHVSVGTDSRRSVGVLPGIVLEADVPAGAGDRVAVSTSLPPGDPSARSRATLALVDGDGGTVAEEGVELRTGWDDHELSFDRGAAGGGRLRLRVTTESPEGALVGSPMLLQRRNEDAADPPRTVLLVTSDTHRADHVGFAGAGIETPTIDGVAARGMRFEEATSATSITNPSHASIFTGLTVKDTGIIGNLVPMSDRADTIAERFQAAGFRTFAATSARHLMPWRSGFGQGFERYDAPREETHRSAEETIATARRMLDDARGDDVFLWLHLFDAHGPYLEHACCTDRYYDGDPYDRSQPLLEEDVRPPWDQKIRDEEYVRALYKGEVTYLDGLLGELLEAEPRLASGWLAITADHGESLGEQGLWWTHTAIYPSTLRVPLVLAGPGVPSGEVVDRPVSNTDVARTLLELAGVPAEGFPGASLVDPARWEAEGEDPRFVLGPNGLSAGVLHDDWYLLLHLRDKFWGNPAPSERHSVELYDLGKDPDAADNVAEQHPERAAKMRRALVRWLADPPPGGGFAAEESTSTEAVADVAALGYAADESSTIDDALIDPECECDECLRWREDP